MNKDSGELLFAGIEKNGEKLTNHFRSIEEILFSEVLFSNKAIIVSAPTGSGKTAIFELAIIRVLMNTPETDLLKIVYVAPIKALCGERYDDWIRKFQEHGISCRQVTGDNDTTDLGELIGVNLIITTPEKWDSLTRKWRDNENLAGTIKLFLIDEIHLINQDVRGPILETVICRMKTIQFSLQVQENSKDSVRFVAVSATIPNIEDLATWFGRKDSVAYFKIGEEERPVHLERHILGFHSSAGGFKFDISLNYKLSAVIRKYSEGKPTLIFCNSRKSVEMASAVLSKEFDVMCLSDNHKAALLALSKRIENSKVKQLVLKAISFHHAGVGYNDRNLIEDAFRRSLILIMVSTSTLAMGVNLPAHLVIIKSTENYIKGSIIEYPESSILQMIGRAGRPQYDDKGIAVIMTQQKNVKKYENLMSGCAPVESHLHKHLAEHLNSEIVLHTITDLEVAMKWMRSTFLYVRAVNSPSNYGLPAGMPRESVEKKLEDMCLTQINELEIYGLLTKDPLHRNSVVSTAYGRLMARYYISFGTMKTFKTICGAENCSNILDIIVSCEEFSECAIRVNDKKFLNAVNTQLVKYRIKGKIKSARDKISCLIQAVLGNVIIQDQGLRQESFRMIRQAERIAKCLAEYIRLAQNQLNNNIFQALLSSITIAKCLKAKMWQDSEFVCKQLKGIGPTYSSLLVNAGKTTIASLEETDPRTLEMILGKPPPFGNEILEGLAEFPDYALELRLKTPNVGQITVVQHKTNYNISGKNDCCLIIGDTDNNFILIDDRVDANIRDCGVYEKSFQIPNPSTQSVHAHLIHGSLVGVDKSTSIVLNPSKEVVGKTRKRKIQSKINAVRSTRQKSLSSRNGAKVTSVNNDDNLILDEDDDYFRDLEVSQYYLCDGRNSQANNQKLNPNDQKLATENLECFKYVKCSQLTKSIPDIENFENIFNENEDWPEAYCENRTAADIGKTLSNEMEKEEINLPSGQLKVTTKKFISDYLIKIPKENLETKSKYFKADNSHGDSSKKSTAVIAVENNKTKEHFEDKEEKMIFEAIFGNSQKMESDDYSRGVHNALHNIQEKMILQQSESGKGRESRSAESDDFAKSTRHMFKYDAEVDSGFSKIIKNAETQTKTVHTPDNIICHNVQSKGNQIIEEKKNEMKSWEKYWDYEDELYPKGFLEDQEQSCNHQRSVEKEARRDEICLSDRNFDIQQRYPVDLSKRSSKISPLRRQDTSSTLKAEPIQALDFRADTNAKNSCPSEGYDSLERREVMSLASLRTATIDGALKYENVVESLSQYPANRSICNSLDTSTPQNGKGSTLVKMECLDDNLLNGVHEFDFKTYCNYNFRKNYFQERFTKELKKETIVCSEASTETNHFTTSGLELAPKMVLFPAENDNHNFLNIDPHRINYFNTKNTNAQIHECSPFNQDPRILAEDILFEEWKNDFRATWRDFRREPQTNSAKDNQARLKDQLDKQSGIGESAFEKDHEENRLCNRNHCVMELSKLVFKHKVGISCVLEMLCDNRLSKYLIPIPDEIPQLEDLGDEDDQQPMNVNARSFLMEVEDGARVSCIKESVLKGPCPSIQDAPSDLNTKASSTSASEGSRNELLKRVFENANRASGKSRPIKKTANYSLKIFRRQKSFLVPKSNTGSYTQAIDRELSALMQANQSLNNNTMQNTLSLHESDKIGYTELFKKTGEVLDYGSWSCANSQLKSEVPNTGKRVTQKYSPSCIHFPEESYNYEDCSDFVSTMSQNLESNESIFPQ